MLVLVRMHSAGRIDSKARHILAGAGHTATPVPFFPSSLGVFYAKYVVKIDSNPVL